jgi:cytochrome c oxidase assembly protein subunit 15
MVGKYGNLSLQTNIKTRNSELEMKVVKGKLEAKRDKRVAVWLLIGVSMVIVQIILGGITRLTGSGLSITEWEVVTGSLPPLSEASWGEEFEKYQKTPQFQLLNSDFTLADFKFIYFWEWFHRLWARFIVLVFAVGFIFFLVRGYFRKDFIKPLVILFLLGGLQGFVGWIMVASGLEGDAVYVKPTRLALHFILALGLLSYTFWFYLRLTDSGQTKKASKALRQFVVVIAALLVIQLMYGALMAGHKAASAAATWPTINGYLLHPPGLFKESHGFLNLIDNKIMVHFVHRGLAYALLLLGLYVHIKFQRKALPDSRLYRSRYWLPGVLGMQVLLGILSVLSSTEIVPNQWGLFEWMAQLHQLTGMVLLLVVVHLLYLTGGGKNPALRVV